MILTCPNCSAQFAIDPDLIGPAGRKVRCGSCGYTWRQASAVENDAQPPPQGPLTAEPSIQEDELSVVRRRSAAAALASSLDRSEPRKSYLVGWLVFGAVVLALAGGLWFGRDHVIDQVPEAARLYALLGVISEVPGEGLAFQEVTSVRRTFDGERRLIVEGIVANETDRDRPVPLLRASLHDETGEELTHWFFRADAEKLSPGERTTFSSQTRNPPDNAAELTVNFVADPPAGTPPDGTR